MTDPFDLDLTPRDIHPWVAEGQERIRFAVSLYPQPADWWHFIRLVQQMERWGFDGYFSYDHPTARTDCWTALAALAATTERIRLGTAVDCIYYRSPYLLARQAADIDRLSGGRLVLGIGIGDAPQEFAQMGLTYPPVATRLRGMEETIRIIRGLWSGKPFSFKGEQWSAETDGSFLGPVQQPRVPIMLAGGGEKDRRQLAVRRPGAQGALEVLLAVREQAGAEPSGRREPQAVAAAAEVVADRRDETDLAGGAGEPKALCRAVHRARRDGDEVAERGEPPADFGHEQRLAAGEARGADGHELDEAHVQRPCERKPREIGRASCRERG